MNKDEFEEKSREWDSNPRIVNMSRAFSDKVREVVKMESHMRLLELGCGTGLVGLSLAPNVESMVMVDNSPSMLAVLREKVSAFDFRNVEIIEGEIAQAGVEEASVDVIISFMAFHHIADIPAVLSVFRKILKTEGSVVIGDLCSEDGGFHSPVRVPHNGFDPDEIRELFEFNGFKVSKFNIFNTVEKPDQVGNLRSYDQFILVAGK